METTDEQKNVDGGDEQFQHIKGVVESLLFVNEKPVMLDRIKKVMETVSSADIKKAIFILQSEYDERSSGMMIVEIAGGYQMLSNPVYASYLRSFYKTKHKEKLSKPALESMAIIAYKQPVTRSDIELIRGVNSDGVVAHLVNKELIKVVGRKDVPGRPFVYGTTKQFLEYFGLKSLDDLPALEEFPLLEPEGENIIEIEDSSSDQEQQEGDVQSQGRLDVDDVQTEDSSEQSMEDVGEISGEMREQVKEAVRENEPGKSS